MKLDKENIKMPKIYKVLSIIEYISLIGVLLIMFLPFVAIFILTKSAYEELYKVWKVLLCTALPILVAISVVIVIITRPMEKRAKAEFIKRKLQQRQGELSADEQIRGDEKYL